MSAVAPTKLTPNTPAMGEQRKYTTDDRARITVETDSIPKMLAKAEEYDRMAAQNRRYFQTEGEAENTDLAAVFREVAAIFERGLTATAAVTAVMSSRAHAVVLPAANAPSGAPLTEAQKFEQLVAANAAKRPTPPLTGV